MIPRFYLEQLRGWKCSRHSQVSPFLTPLCASSHTHYWWVSVADTLGLLSLILRKKIYSMRLLLNLILFSHWHSIKLIISDEFILQQRADIIEDILDTGLTLSYIVDILKSRNPNSVKICTFLDKPERRKADIKADYTGVSVPDEFVVGYGLDYDEKYRNLPFVGILKPEIYS
jgi:hypothetical protein